MARFKGTPGQWTVEEGWADNHVSISAPRHGAIAQVVFGMEDPVNDFNADAYARKQNELAANVRAFACAGEMAQLIIEMSNLKCNYDGYDEAIAKLAHKLNSLDFSKVV